MDLEDNDQIAIISDIHANKYALEKFLKFVEEKSNIILILNLGEFLQIGPHPKEVAEIILNDARFINILGNNELIISKNLNLIAREDETGHSNWTKQQIGLNSLTKIKELPTSRILNLNGKKFLMTHLRIYNKDRSNLWEFPLLYSKKSLSKFVRDYPKNLKFVLYGHTHHQLYLHWRGRYFINPGSLGCSIHESTISYCVLEVNGEHFNVNLQNEAYDETRLIEDYYKLEVPDSKFILKYFYQKNNL
ncbi:MAG: metallophosphoesterase family protein [Candidatus Thorarchaeota archaeon]